MTTPTPNTPPRPRRHHTTTSPATTTPIFKAMLYSPREVAERLGISTGTLKRWRTLHGFPAIKIGATIKHNGADVNAWLAARDATIRTP